MTRSLRTVLSGVVALATILIAAGCSAGAPEPLQAPSALPASTDELDVAAEVYRTRSDPARGGLQLSLRNDGAAVLTIVHAALESPALAETIERERTLEIGSGLTRDLALTLTAATCPATEAEPPDAVLTVLLADGSTADVRVPTVDRLGQWSEWVAAECFAAAVAERAAITVRHDAARDEGALIGLRLEVEANRDGLELVALRDTVLFSLVLPGDGARVTSVALPGAAGQGSADGQGAADGQGVVSIPALLTPARCDAHALAEDKQGTLFRVDVRLDGEAGVVTIVADAATRGALYDAFTRACGLRG